MQNEVAASRQQSTVPSLAAERIKRKILLVEDEETVRELLTEVLRRQGYDVLPCAHPKEGIAAGLQHAAGIDLLLTDVVMPGMNGREMAELIQQATPDLRVIFMSGYAEEVLLQNGRINAHFEYLQKPFTLKSLLGKLSEVLGEEAANLQ